MLKFNNNNEIVFVLDKKNYNLEKNNEEYREFVILITDPNNKKINKKVFDYDDTKLNEDQKNRIKTYKDFFIDFIDQRNQYIKKTNIDKKTYEENKNIINEIIDDLKQ